MLGNIHSITLTLIAEIPGSYVELEDYDASGSATKPLCYHESNMELSFLSRI